MKIQMSPRLHPRRGGPVEVGNVYSNPHGKNFYKIVVGIIERDVHDAPWNNVVMLHVNSAEQIVGSSVQPQLYVSEHQDLVGRVKTMPTLKIEWLTKEDK